MTHILSYGSYLPRNVLSRAAVQEAWPNWAVGVASRRVMSLDEDVITMAAEAAMRALTRGRVEGQDLSVIYVATTSSPYTAKSSAALVADYLGAQASTMVLDVGAGTQAGLAALVTAMRDGQAAKRGPVLVVAVDAIRADPGHPSDVEYGAAAAAFVISDHGFATLDAATYRYSSHSGTWAAVGDTALRRYDDDRFERSAGLEAQALPAVQELLKQTDQEPAWLALHATAASAGRAAAGLGLDPTRVLGPELVQRIGDTGCANTLLSLGLALDRAEPGDTVGGLAYGAGAGTVAASFRVTGSRDWNGSMIDDTATQQLSYIQYAKHRGLLPLATLPTLGAPFGASPANHRTWPASVSLHAGRCTVCGSLNFPSRHYCLDCRGQSFDPVPLPRTGHIATYNLQHVVSIGPEEAPLPICTVVLDGEPADRYGGKIAALITDADPADIHVGMSVELVPRRGNVEDGLVTYGWKFRPLPEDVS